MHYFSSLLFILIVLEPTSEGKRTARVLIQGKNGTLSSPWLRTVMKKSRPEGCWSRPWVCGQGEFPLFRRRCCWNRCIDVWTDPNHCGLCNIKCPFNWQCCRGRCRNINRNPFHCGKCFNRCPLFSRCRFGMCGYAQPWPKFPFPIPSMPPTGWPPSGLRRKRRSVQISHPKVKSKLDQIKVVCLIVARVLLLFVYRTLSSSSKKKIPSTEFHGFASFS